jgi:hypothetical protein
LKSNPKNMANDVPHQERGAIEFLRRGMLILGLVGMGLCAYLSLRTSSALGTVGWLPHGVARWADAHGRFDNFPAYGLVGLPLFLLVTSCRRQLAVFVGLIGFIALLEFAQRAIPTRHCDVWDLIYGGLGLATAWAVAAGGGKLWLTVKGVKPIPAA